MVFFLPLEGRRGVEEESFILLIKESDKKKGREKLWGNTGNVEKSLIKRKGTTVRRQTIDWGGEERTHHGWRRPLGRDANA